MSSAWRKVKLPRVKDNCKSEKRLDSRIIQKTGRQLYFKQANHLYRKKKKEMLRRVEFVGAA